MASIIRYTDEEKKAALQVYVDLGRNLSKAANETGIPYTTMRPWIASDWGKLFMANYELETKGELNASAMKEVLDIGVEHYRNETVLIAETEIIMGKVIKRMNEVIGNEKNLKNLTELFKALNDVLAHSRDKDGENKNGATDKDRFILDLIEKQMIVKPIQLQDL